MVCLAANAGGLPLTRSCEGHLLPLPPPALGRVRKGALGLRLGPQARPALLGLDAGRGQQGRLPRVARLRHGSRLRWERRLHPRQPEPPPAARICEWPLSCPPSRPCLHVLIAALQVGGPPFDLPDRSGGGCLTNGPFAGLSTRLGPQNKTDGTAQLCVRRDFSYNSLRDLASSAQVQAALAIADYGSFEFITDTQSFHPAGHWATGGLYGTMTDTYCSPADPIFYLHHSNVDRAWWSWQTRNLPKREKEISGPLFFFDYQNLRGGNATLTTPVWVGLVNRVQFKAGELLHIRKGPFCYTYDVLY